MALDLSLIDDQYPFGKSAPRTRVIVRAILFSDPGNIILHKISRDDQFGDWEYYETPGGGVEKDESLEEALARECDEETGYDIEIIGKIGVIKDEYRLINRTNVNHYYLCKTKGNKHKTHMVSEGDSLIEKTFSVSLEEAISLYEKLPDESLPLLMKRRELPVLLEVRRILSKDKEKS